MHYIFGYHAVTAFLKSHPQNITALYLQSGKKFADLQKYIDTRGYVLYNSEMWRDKCAHN
jgi:tRNA G18 (ribose-2'-O)-methylase SpoU